MQTVQTLRLKTSEYLDLPCEIYYALRKGWVFMEGYSDEGVKLEAENLQGYVAIVQCIHLKTTARYTEGPGHYSLCSFNATSIQSAFKSAALRAKFTKECAQDYNMFEEEWYDRDMRVVELWQTQDLIDTAVLWGDLTDDMLKSMTQDGLTDSQLLRQWVQGENIASDLAFKVSGGPRDFQYADIAGRRNGEIIRSTIEKHDRLHERLRRRVLLPKHSLRIKVVVVNSPAQRALYRVPARGTA